MLKTDVPRANCQLREHLPDGPMLTIHTSRGASEFYLLYSEVHVRNKNLGLFCKELIT